MSHFNIKTFNSIAMEGLQRFSKEYYKINESENPEAIVLRSYNLHDEPINDNLLAVGRAAVSYTHLTLPTILRV